jgi:hypothetical protein
MSVNIIAASWRDWAGMVLQITKNTIKMHYSENGERLLSANSGRSGFG